MSWYLDVLRKYAVFEGRARRKEYWIFALFNVIISTVLSAVDALSGSFSGELGLGLLGGLYGLAVFIPALGVTVRRLHDTDRSGWWLLIAFVPIVGAIVLLVFMCLDSTPGPNQFGTNPKEAVATG